MQINNGLTTVPLEAINVDVLFTDENGLPVRASSNPDDPDAFFFIRIDSMDGVADVTGTGSVEPSTTADIHWLIIPAPASVENFPTGAIYYVGARLSYTIGGEEHVTVVTPDYIHVQPLPLLTLDYFLPDEVYGDDPFTAPIEPSIPFSLGVRIANNGHGTAWDLKINSAQPKIVDNDQGLAVDFLIEGSEVNGVTAPDTLLMEFGDIGPMTSPIGRWLMTSSLSGRFVEFRAEFSHADDLGGELTSLMEAVNTHFLVRDVLVDASGRDSIRDFLGKDNDVYRVYESDAGITDVADLSAGVQLILESDTGDEAVYTLVVTPTSGFIYLVFDDPQLGSKIISEIIRSDGKIIKPENGWLSKKRVDADWSYYGNLFDFNTPGTYTLTMIDPSLAPTAPEFEEQEDPVFKEGEEVVFYINVAGQGSASQPQTLMFSAFSFSAAAPASSPSGCSEEITITAGRLPVGAEFVDLGNGTAMVRWTPEAGQSGDYPMSFAATGCDLSGSVRYHMTITDIANTPTAQFSATPTEGEVPLDVTFTDESLSVDGIASWSWNFGDGSFSTAQHPNHTYVREGTFWASLTVTEIDGDSHTSNTVAISVTANNQPQVTAFQIPVDAHSLLVPIEVFTATDNLAVNGYLVTESAVAPAVDDPDWQATPPADYVFSSSGAKTLYAWARDEDNNISTSISAAVNIAIIFVDSNVANPGNGTSWPDAFSSLQDALAAAQSGEVIWVMSGVYRPDHGAGEVLGDRYASFPLQTGVALYGGFSGQETELTQRDWLRNETVLSGDLIGNDGQNFTGMDENSLHVLTAGNIDATAILDGFIIRGGNANDAFFPNNVGGGIYLNASSPMVANNIFTNNQALTDGGALYSDSSSPAIHRSIFTNNIAMGYGGALYSSSGILTLTNTVLSHNRANEGGGLYLNSASDAIILNSNIIFNTAESSGGGIFNGAENTVLEDSIVWGNTAVSGMQISQAGVATISISFSDLEGGEAAINNADSSAVALYANNIDANPLFGSQSHLQSGSPCIDAGNPASSLNKDIDGEDRPQGTTIDIGADEFTDSDLDALPDYWESKWFNNLDQNETTDWEGDGVSDLDEYIHASNPLIDDWPMADAGLDQTVDEGQQVTLDASSSSDPDNEIVSYLWSQLSGTVVATSDPTQQQLTFVAPEVGGVGEILIFQLLVTDSSGLQSQDSIAISVTDSAPLNVSVTTSMGGVLVETTVYAFDDTGSYTGVSALTDENGQAFFDKQLLLDGNYTFKVDYLSYQFWTPVIEIPASISTAIVIEEEQVETTVVAAGVPTSGIIVTLFHADGSDLGQYLNTDQTGKVTFILPVGMDFQLQADYLGSQYWSGIIHVAGGGPNYITIDTGGGLLTLTVQKGPGLPMTGINTYLFSESGLYLGKDAVTDASGQVVFLVPGGNYQIRGDYLGYNFWSDLGQVFGDTEIILTIPHQDVTITVAGDYNGDQQPKAGITANLFTPAGSYLDTFQITDEDGLAVFNLPEMAYTVQADILGKHYWSREFVWNDGDIIIEDGLAVVTVTNNSTEIELEDIETYVFSDSGSYLGINKSTDDYGQVIYRLPQGDYNIRADYLGNQYWSGLTTIIPHVENPVIVSTGGGRLTMTLLKGVDQPMAGVKCYLFDESDNYLGEKGVTSDMGEVNFDLSDGAYRIRVDYLGYQFWTEVFTVPDTLDFTFTIPHQKITVTVAGDYNGSLTPLKKVKTYLFTPSGTYLRQHKKTNAMGQVTFNLPFMDYQVRADYLSGQYWSEIFNGINTEILLAEAVADVQVVRDGIGVKKARVRVFDSMGNSLGIKAKTDRNGRVSFRLPAGLYKFRADFRGNRYWSTARLEPHMVNNVTIDTSDGSFVLTVNDQNGTPLINVPVFVFSVSGRGKDWEDDDKGHEHDDRDWENKDKDRKDEESSCVQSRDKGFSKKSGKKKNCTDKSKKTKDKQSKKRRKDSRKKSSKDYTYLGLHGHTNDFGEIAFDLAAGKYKFRADYLGYQFWSSKARVPKTLVSMLTIKHHDVMVSAVSNDGITQAPLANVTCSLFDASGSDLGQYQITDKSGLAVFSLPDKDYKVRLDYLGSQYWSDILARGNNELYIDHGQVNIHVTSNGADVSNAPVYLFSGTGAYLGTKNMTDILGKTTFNLPVDTFKFRIDYGGVQYWSDLVDVPFSAQLNLELPLELLALDLLKVFENGVVADSWGESIFE